MIGLRLIVSAASAKLLRLLRMREATREVLAIPRHEADERMAHL
jgi:hypothetical protein